MVAASARFAESFGKVGIAPGDDGAWLLSGRPRCPGALCVTTVGIGHDVEATSVDTPLTLMVALDGTGTAMGL